MMKRWNLRQGTPEFGYYHVVDEDGKTIAPYVKKEDGELIVGERNDAVDREMGIDESLIDGDWGSK